MKNIQKTKAYGGNFKNNIVLEFPCDPDGAEIAHVRLGGGSPPTIVDIANALAEHCEDCEYCNSEG